MTTFKEKLEHAVMAAWNAEWPDGKISVKEIMQLIWDENCNRARNDVDDYGLMDLGEYLKDMVKECGGDA